MYCTSAEPPRPSPSELFEEDVDVEAALPVQQVDLAPLLPPLVLALLINPGHAWDTGVVSHSRPLKKETRGIHVFVIEARGRKKMSKSLTIGEGPQSSCLILLRIFTCSNRTF